MATAAPSRSKRSAMARPIPRVPPVTTASFPERDSICEILSRIARIAPASALQWF